MSEPFFKSEKLETCDNAIWPEINCQSILKSTSQSVYIRVWQHDSNTTKLKSSIKPANTSDGDTNDGMGNNSNSITDEVLFLWGVYFSGLVPITKRTDVELMENSLVFHIHGGFFTSAEHLLSKNIPKQLAFIGVIETLRATTDSTGCDQELVNRKSIINTNTLQPTLAITNQQDNDLSNLLDDLKKSPKPTVAIDQQHPTSASLKVRYIEKSFFKTEIRSSYNVHKLLQLQEKQRRIRYKTENAKKVMDEICTKSAFCLNLELIANRTKYRPRPIPSMGRTLNRLLFEQIEQPKPEVLLKAQEIRRKIETAKFRCRLLVQERNQAKMNLRQLNKQLGELSDANIVQEYYIMENYREWGKEKKDAPNEQNYSLTGQMIHLDQINYALQQRRYQLMRELKEIYLIQQINNGVFTINGAALPSLKCLNDLVSASDISVALGYAAHITIMCSKILNCPLRNPILYKGSASKVMDNVRVMPDSERE